MTTDENVAPVTPEERIVALRANPDSIKTLGELLAAKTGDPGYLGSDDDEGEEA